MNTEATPIAHRGVILLAEDDPSVLSAIGDVLQDAGFDVLRAVSGMEALRKLSDRVHLLITDLWMPNMDGLALMEDARLKFPLLEVIMITGNATVASAVQAMKSGAFDYLTKPFAPPQLLAVVDRAMEHRRMRDEIARWKAGEPVETQVRHLIGQSPSMQAVYESIQRVAPFKSIVLVQGESGTGKEVVVRAIHELSPRKDQPFVAINCAAVPANLMESELFGHERGAFTGANARTTGYFEAAHRGTLFIDEVAELDTAMQAKLLRVLETGRVMPVGSVREKAVDVRVLAATNVDLRMAVEDKQFRADLFYRLNVVRIDLPPLRDRTDDVPLLVRHLLERLCSEHALVVPEVEAGAMAALQHYPWPGNVRELRNMLESMLILKQPQTIMESDIPESIRRGGGVDGTAALADLDVAERDTIEKAVKHSGGDRTRAAQMLRISVRTLYRKMAKYGLR